MSPTVFTKEQLDRVAERFLAFRKAHMLTQGLMAELLRVSKQTVGNIELRRTGISYGTMRKFLELEDEYAGKRQLSRSGKGEIRWQSVV